MSDNLQQNFTSAAAQFEQTLAAGYPTAELEAVRRSAVAWAGGGDACRSHKQPNPSGLRQSVWDG